MEAHTNTVILARVSSKAQEDEGYSLDSQLKLLSGYCHNKDLNVIKVFKIAETASKEQSRKVFHEMLLYISKNQVYHLAVEKTDRFTRNFRDAVAIDEWLEKDPERHLHAVKENLLLHKEAKSDVKFMWNIHLSVAKRYADNLREEAMKGWAEKLAQGWLPGVPPPGYKTITENGKRIHVPNPETKDLVEQVFRKYLEPGESIVSVTGHMDALGIRTRKGHPYNKSKVQKMLGNPFYISINRFNGQDYPGAQEPILSKDLYRNVQIKLHRGRPLAYAKHNSPLKGLIRCQDCGTVITWQLQKGHYYGACRRDKPGCKKSKLLCEDYVETKLLALMQELVSPAAEVIDWVAEAMRGRYQDVIDNREQQIKALKAQIERLSRMENTLYEDKLSGDITKGKYEEKHGQFVSQRQVLNEQLANLETSSDQRLEERLMLLELTQKAAEIYQHKTAEQKRLILSKLFVNLTLHNGFLSVKPTNFASAIAEKVQITRNLMEA